MGAAGLLAESENLQIGQQEQLRIERGPAAVEVGGANLERSRRQRRRSAVGGAAAVAPGKDVLLFEQLGEAVDLIGGDRHAPAILQPLPHAPPRHRASRPANRGGSTNATSSSRERLLQCGSAQSEHPARVERAPD